MDLRPALVPKSLKCLHVVVSLHNANSYNSKAPNEACKTELKFSFGRCGGYKNMQRKGHMDEMEKWRGEREEICSVKYMVFEDGCRSQRADG